jgi:hypothetical protein
MIPGIIKHSLDASHGRAKEEKPKVGAKDEKITNIATKIKKNKDEMPSNKKPIEATIFTGEKEETFDESVLHDDTFKKELAEHKEYRRAQKHFNKAAEEVKAQYRKSDSPHFDPEAFELIVEGAKTFEARKRGETPKTQESSPINVTNEPLVAIQSDSIKNDIKKRLKILKAQKTKLEGSEEKTKKEELVEVKKAINKLKKVKNSYKQAQVQLDEYLEFTGEKKPTEKELTLKAIDTKVAEYQSMFSKPVEKVKTAIDVLQKAKGYVNDIKSKINKNAEFLDSPQALKGMNDSGGISANLIEEWKLSGVKDFKEFFNAKISKTISDSYKEMEELENKIKEKFESTVGEKLESLDKLYDSLIDKTQAQREAFVSAMNTAGLNSSTAKGVTKAVEILYTVGSFMKKPSDETDQEIRALFELNKKKNEFLDNIGEFITNPKEKVKTGFGLT